MGRKTCWTLWLSYGARCQGRAGWWLQAPVHETRWVHKAFPEVDAFSSGEAGPRGWVEEGRVRWLRRLSANQFKPHSPVGMICGAGCTAGLVVLSAAGTQWPYGDAW